MGVPRPRDASERPAPELTGELRALEGDRTEPGIGVAIR